MAADLLSALDFDETGDYLATGDRGGRVVIFEHLACRKASGRSAVRHERADDERQRGAAASARDRDVYSSDEEADAELGANGRPRRRRRDDDDGSASTEGVDNGGALYNFLTEFQARAREAATPRERDTALRSCVGAGAAAAAPPGAASLRSALRSHGPLPPAGGEWTQSGLAGWKDLDHSHALFLCACACV